MKTLWISVLFALFFASAFWAKGQSALDERVYIEAAVAKAAAKPETLDLRAALMNPATPETAKPALTMKLNAIFAAAQAEGKMEYKKAYDAKMNALLKTLGKRP